MFKHLFGVLSNFAGLSSKKKWLRQQLYNNDGLLNFSSY
uniref:Uncharacterized protein n=1 Tax=Rhizophora mucronata TaxID=61149 RepID=A0A2P2QXH7_RHIMU